MTKTTLVFDSAGNDIFLWVHDDGKEKVVGEHQPRRSFLTVFPERFAIFLRDVPIGPETKVYLGSGPGSFTGLKSGASLVGAFLYARGVREVFCISSLDLLTARAVPPVGSTCLTVLPFHEEEMFAVVVRWEEDAIIPLIAPTLVYAKEVGSLLFRKEIVPDMIIAEENLPSAIDRSLVTAFPSLPRKVPGKMLSVSCLARIPVTTVVDMRRDLLRLRYLAAPAALREDDMAQYVLTD